MVPVRIDANINASPGAAAALACLTALAVLAAFTNGLILPLQVVIAVFAMVVGGHAAWRLLHPGLRRLRLDGNGLRLQFHSGDREGRLVGRPFVSPVYIGLRWKDDRLSLPRSCGIFRDQMGGEDFRRLCAALRQRSE